MRRGRILLVPRDRREGQQQECTSTSSHPTTAPPTGGDEIRQSCDESSTQHQQQPPCRVSRGRAGHLLSRLSQLSVSQQPVTERPAQAPIIDEHLQSSIRAANSNSDGGSNNHGGSTPHSRGSDSPRLGQLSRQGSDVSRDSSVHFATVEPVNYKAKLSKQPSKAGVGVKLSLNYMTFQTDGDCSIEEYHAVFEPNIEDARIRCRILRSEAAQAVIGQTMHWTGTNLYLPVKLPQKVSNFDATHPVTGAAVKVQVRFVKTPPDSELLPFYNSLMHRVMNRLQYVIINRQHYSPLHKIAIEQHKIELWPGWITAIQRLDGGLKLSIDASFRVLRLETVRDIMIAVKQQCRGTSLQANWERELVGTIVMTKYNNKTYRLDGIDTQKNPTHKFLLSRDGREVSYVEYMREHWNIQIQDLQQPLLVHQPKPKRGEETTDIIYLVPELCVTTGLTDEMRANFNIMKSIADHTRLPPDIRESKLGEFINQIATDERARSVLSAWNLSVSPNLDMVEGRRLDSETVLFGASRSAKVGPDADWTRPATSGVVFQTTEIDNWVIMCPERDWANAVDFLECFKDVTRNLGIKFSPPKCVKLPNDSTVTYVSHGKRETNRSVQLVVILTPGKSQREDRYSACKRLYGCEIPTPSQFIRCGTIANPRRVRSICQKIALQVLAKVGGQPWGMKFPMKRFMVVGIDVYHDTVDRKKSCVGVVASMNEFTSSWWSHAFFQNSLEEIGQKLHMTICNAVRKYHTINQCVPERIIIYRDGVGDGQLDTVLNIEITQIMNGLKFYFRDSFSDEQLPSISYIVVQKRINAKFSLRAGGRIVNPEPGTFLDNTITHPEYSDFYLVSQHVNQGTVSPTKYIVLTETGTLKLEHHQKLAYKMTHMYYNWTGTIRVPAPCQYAHKLAYLVGQNIRQQPSERLDSKLHFL